MVASSGIRAGLALALAGVLAGAVGGTEAPAPSPALSAPPSPHGGEGRDERSESGVRGRSCPLWDAAESVEQYARRANLEPTKTLDLGNGVSLEMVLIPAGKFTMGTPEPPPVDEEGFRRKIVTGQAFVAASVGVLLVLLGTVVIRAVGQRRRPQYSLARFVAMIVAAGVGVLGGTHWWESARILAEAKAEYQAASARFKDSYETEKPAHEVTISKPYYLGRFEVTQEQYQQVMGVNPSDFKGRNLPVENVSWDEAQEFCKKASGKTGLAVRLPTDAEWEHACRAGTKTTYYTGDAETDLERAAWYGKNSGNTTHPVGQKVANAWGVYDMHGNVWEWVQDFYEPYKAEAVADPQGPAQGQYRVLRGGSWLIIPRDCRSANRLWINPDYRYNIVGFRVAAWVPRTP
jgi:formylglycine-generating enzyme required for sulfatase activity